MAELHSRLYIKANAFQHARYHELLQSISNGEQAILRAAEKIDTENGSAKSSRWVNKLGSYGLSQLPLESIEEKEGYWVAIIISGSGGDQIIGDLVEFFYELDKSIDSRAWGYGDDDPWEYCFLWRNGKLLRFDNEPFEDNDSRAWNTIYRLWHDGIPSSIKEGLLNDEADHSHSDNFDAEEYAAWLSHLDEKKKLQLSNTAVDEGVDIRKIVIFSLAGAFTPWAVSFTLLPPPYQDTHWLVYIASSATLAAGFLRINLKSLKTR